MAIDEVGTLNSPLARPVWLFEGPPVPGPVGIGLRNGSTRGDPMPLDWDETAINPEAVTCRLHVDPEADLAACDELVPATIVAWYVAGCNERLYNVRGRLHWSSDPVRENQADVTWYEWDIDGGSADFPSAFQRLAVALGKQIVALLGPTAEVLTRLEVR